MLEIASAQASISANIHSSNEKMLLSPASQASVRFTPVDTCRLVMVRRRASSDRVDMGTVNGESGMCSSLNLMEIS